MSRAAGAWGCSCQFQFQLLPNLSSSCAPPLAAAAAAGRSLLLQPCCGWTRWGRWLHAARAAWRPRARARPSLPRHLLPLPAWLGLLPSHSLEEHTAAQAHACSTLRAPLPGARPAAPSNHVRQVCGAQGHRGQPHEAGEGRMGGGLHAWPTRTACFMSFLPRAVARASAATTAAPARGPSLLKLVARTP